MFSETAPDAIWSGRPSVRAAVVGLVASAVITVAVWHLIPFGIKALYEATAGWPLWSYHTLMALQWGIKGLMMLGVILNIWRVIKLWTVRYEVTSDRFLHHHGILVRRHDQIELRRIRDFRVINPIFSQSLGLGKVWMIARDETSPEMTIGPFLDARMVHDTIRDAVLEHQRATGYREFESHPGG